MIYKLFPRTDSCKLRRCLTTTARRYKGQATLCVQSAQYRTRSSEIAFLRTVQVWLGTCDSYQLNIVSDYAITQYGTNASDIAHLVRIVCSGLNTLATRPTVGRGPPSSTGHGELFSPCLSRPVLDVDLVGLPPPAAPLLPPLLPPSAAPSAAPRPLYCPRPLNVRAGWRHS